MCIFNPNLSVRLWIHKSVSRIQVSRKLARKPYLADRVATPPELN